MKTLVVCPYSGIADRVRLILFALQLCKKTGRELSVIWEENFHLGCPFDKLFQSDAFTVVQASEFNGEAMIDFDQSSEISIEKVVMGSTCDVLKIRAFVDGFSYARFPKIFKPSMEVALLVEQWFRTQNDVGVNVRVGDKRDDMPPIEEYFKEVDKLLVDRPQARIFLVTDGDDDLIQEFIKVYKERLIFYPMRSLDRNTEEHCIDAVVTLYLLRQCDTLVTSNYSGFSRLAAGRSRREMPGKIGTYSRL